MSPNVRSLHKLAVRPAGPLSIDAARRGAARELRRREDALVADEPRGEPLVLRAGLAGSPAAEVGAVEERLPAVLEQVRRIAVRFAVLHHGVARRLQHEPKGEEENASAHWLTILSRGR